jgi:hypothetical protein
MNQLGYVHVFSNMSISIIFDNLLMVVSILLYNLDDLGVPLYESTYLANDWPELMGNFCNTVSLSLYKPL